MGTVDKAWDAVSVSFDRFCLTAGIEALGTMMEQDAEQACGARHARSDGRRGHRWGRTQGKIGFHAGKVAVERPRVRDLEGQELALPSWERAVAEDYPIRQTIQAHGEIGPQILSQMRIAAPAQITAANPHLTTSVIVSMFCGAPQLGHRFVNRSGLIGVPHFSQKRNAICLQSCCCPYRLDVAFRATARDCGRWNRTANPVKRDTSRFKVRSAGR